MELFAAGATPALVIGVLTSVVLCWAWRGPRRLRPLLLAVSGPVLVLCLAWGALAWWTRGGDLHAMRFKPASWLLTDATGGDVRRRDAALAEFARRIAEGRVAPDREREVIELALAHQADGSKAWVHGWGYVVEMARAAGRVPNDQWRRYQAQALTLRLEPDAPTVRPSLGLGLILRRGPDRLSASPGFRFQVGLHVRPGLKVAGEQLNGWIPPVEYVSTATTPLYPAMPDEAFYGVFTVPNPDASGTNHTLGATRVGLNQARLASLPAGPHTAAVTAIVRLLRVEEGHWREPRRYVFEGPDRRVEVSTRWELGQTVAQEKEAAEQRRPLDDFASPEFKGVWIPPTHRDAVLRDAARRREIEKRAKD